MVLVYVYCVYPMLNPQHLIPLQPLFESIYFSAHYTLHSLDVSIAQSPFKLRPIMLCMYCSHPFMYFPAFYTVKSLVERQPHPLDHAYNKWRNEIWDSCKALWCLWVPAQLLNFAVVPRYLRVPFGKLHCFYLASVVSGGCDPSNRYLGYNRM